MQLKQITDIKEAFDLETKCYPSDEACSWENIQYRFTNAPELFLGAFDGKLIGFMMATASDSLSLESMSTHDPNGSTICIHSVCVDPEYRRKGIATLLLQEYKKIHSKKRLSLLAHKNLIGLYESVGFKTIGLSSIVHGSEPWYELSTC